jgi:hypothetical protein
MVMSRALASAAESVRHFRIQGSRSYGCVSSDAPYPSASSIVAARAMNASLDGASRTPARSTSSARIDVR